MSKREIITSVKDWVTPVMIAIIGYLAKDKLESIDAKVSKIEMIREQQIVNVQEIASIKDNMSDLKIRFDNHLAVFAKTEEELTLDKLKKQK